MKPYYQEPIATLYNGQVMTVSQDLPADSVQCVVTSPPYWGLRKYDGEQNYVWGDWEGAYGLEPTVELYVAHTVEILQAIKRVLRPDGIVWWNIGDSYASGFSTSDNKYKAMIGAEPSMVLETGIPAKNLCLIPFRVALAAQADG